MSHPEEKNGNVAINHNTKITLAVVLVAVPLVVWAAKVDNRIENLEKERAELRADIRDLNRKMDQLLAELHSKWQQSKQ